MILIQGAQDPSIQFLPTNLDGRPRIVFKWAFNLNAPPNSSIDSGARDPSI